VTVTSSPSGGVVGGSKHPEDEQRGLAQHAVPRAVAVAVVDRLEVVEVDQGDGERPAPARHALRARMAILDVTLSNFGAPKFDSVR